jgi:hypothetical protein
MTWEGGEENYNVFRWYRAGWGRYSQADPTSSIDPPDADADRDTLPRPEKPAPGFGRKRVPRKLRLGVQLIALFAWRRVFSVHIVALAYTAIAGVPASNTVEPFRSFFTRFVRDDGFRSTRISYPLTAFIGNQDSDEVHHYRWSKRQVAAKMEPPVSAADLASRGLEERIVCNDSHHMTVFQFRPEADSYMIEYQFTRRGRAWFLTVYRDSSM